MVVVYVEAGGCPNTCRHCSTGGRAPCGAFYSLQELMRLREEWGPLLISQEPSAHPAFPEVVHPRLTDLGGYLPTNGYGIARRPDHQDILDRMREMGFHTVYLTLHGLREHHDGFVGRQGAYDDILLASRRLADAGFKVSWQVFLDNRNLEDVQTLAGMAGGEYDAPICLSIPAHRVSRRLWSYERLRPSLREIRERLPEPLQAQLLKEPLSGFTEDAWMQRWREVSDVRAFRNPFEPPSWPPAPPFEDRALFLDRDHKVWLDPYCAPPVLLGDVAEGKYAILRRLQAVPMPERVMMGPPLRSIAGLGGDLVHPNGTSVRYKAIAAARHRGR